MVTGLAMCARRSGSLNRRIVSRAVAVTSCPTTLRTETKRNAGRLGLGLPSRAFRYCANSSTSTGSTQSSQRKIDTMDLAFRHIAENLLRRGNDLIFVRAQHSDLRLSQVCQAV